LDADDCIFKDVYQIREETLSHKYRILMKKGW
jgi:protein gp37